MGIHRAAARGFEPSCYEEVTAAIESNNVALPAQHIPAHSTQMRSEASLATPHRLSVYAYILGTWCLFDVLPCPLSDDSRAPPCSRRAPSGRRCCSCASEGLRCTCFIRFRALRGRQPAEPSVRTLRGRSVAEVRTWREVCRSDLRDLWGSWPRAGRHLAKLSSHAT